MRCQFTKLQFGQKQIPSHSETCSCHLPSRAPVGGTSCSERAETGGPVGPYLTTHHSEISRNCSTSRKDWHIYLFFNIHCEAVSML